MPSMSLSYRFPPMRSADNLFPQMYEFATGRWLFNPDVVDDIPRDIVHLAQMTQRIGQDHDDAVLKQYEIRKKQCDLKGNETHSNVHRFIYLCHLQAR